MFAAEHFANSVWRDTRNVKFICERHENVGRKYVAGQTLLFSADAYFE